MWRDEGEDKAGGSALKSLTLAQAAMSADPAAITLGPCPGYYLKPNKYQGLNVTTRTLEPHLHQSVSRVSNHPFSFLCQQIHLPRSYTQLHTPIRPLTTTLRGGTVQQIYDPQSQAKHDLLTLVVSFLFEKLHVELILSTS